MEIRTLNKLGEPPREQKIPESQRRRSHASESKRALRAKARVKGAYSTNLCQYRPSPSQAFAAAPEPSPGDLFVDLEGDPLAMEGGIEYLVGVTEAGPERGRFTALWGTNGPIRETRIRIVHATRERTACPDPNLHVYHYAPYEPSAFLHSIAAQHL